MWIFNSPKVVFGDDALEHLENIQGHRAFIVTDTNMVQFVDYLDGEEQDQESEIEIQYVDELEEA